MNWLPAVMVAMQVLFHVEVVGDYMMVIHNDSSVPISCVLFYEDGDISNVYIPAFGRSRGLTRIGLTDLGCFQ